MRLPLLIAGLLPFAVLAADAQQAPVAEDLLIENLDEKGDLSGDLQNRTWVGSRGVIVKYGQTVLIANELMLNETTGEIVADGMVTLQGEGMYWTGDHLEYNFKTREIASGSYRAGAAGIFIRAETLKGTGGETASFYEAGNALVTPDDVEEPLFHVKAKKLRLTNGKDAEIEGATFYAGKVPFFYLPYYQRNLGTHPNYISLTPGVRSTFGPYLLTHYHYHFNTNFDAGLNLDFRTKRGVGLGPDIHYDLGNIGEGAFRYYYAKDGDAHDDPLLRGFGEDRQRVRFSHIANLQPGLSVKADVHYQSDPRVIRDLFEAEYRTNAQPVTIVEGSKFWRNFSLSAVVQPQVNEFFPSVERLPDVKLSALRQQIGVTPLFYEGESSMAYLRNQASMLGGTNYAGARGDSYHQIVAPRQFFGWLNVEPRVGGRFTYYSESDEPLAPATDEQTRFVFNTGMEANFKASRVFPGARSRLLDVNELRHIVEPSINYVFVPTPDDRPRELPQYDYEVPSLRLMPIEFPDYNRVDSIDAQNVIRLGVRNKWQTKRDGEIDTLLNWWVVSDWRLNPLVGQQTFSDIYSDLDFKPRRWLVFNSELRYDIDDGKFNLASHSVAIQPNDVWSARLGHRYFAGDPALGPQSDNNIVFTTFFYRFNENWGARVSHHFEARDGTLEEQYYTVYRDFRSWTGALTLRLRDHRTGRTDYAIAFALSLKHAPRSRGSERVEPSYLLGN